MALFVVLLGFGSGAVHAQTQLLDSLKTALATATDTNKVNTLNKIAYTYANTEPKEVQKYAKQALELAEQYGYLRGKSVALGLIGVYYERFGDYSMALEYKLQSLRVGEQLQELGNLARGYNSVGTLYFRQKNYQKALEYYFKALEVIKKTDNRAGESVFLLNIGEAYQEMGDLEKAIDYEERSMLISKQVPNMDDCVAFSLGIIGQCHAAQGKYNLALRNMQETIRIFRKIDDKTSLTEYLIDIANVYRKTGQYAQAVTHLNEAVDISKAIDNKALEKDAYIALADIKAKQGDFAEAYTYQQQYIALNDSIFNEGNAERIARLQSLYESEKKQAEIEMLQKDKQLGEDAARISRLFNYFFLALTVFVIVLAIVLYRSVVQKQRSNKLLLAQNQQIASQQLAITSSITYAKRIQTAILPEEGEIKKLLPESFVFYRPRDVVSGDFYYVATAPNGQIVVVAADCTGHGVPGAFMSMMGSTLLNQIINIQEISSPQMVLDELNRDVRQMLRQHESDNRDGMDLALCAIDLPNRKMYFSGAKNSLYIIENQNLREIKGDKLSIGGHQFKSGSFTYHEIDMQPGSTYYFSTDGFGDQFGGLQNKKFSSRRFKETLLQMQPLPIETQREHLAVQFDQWKQGFPQTDDVLVIGWRC